MADRLLDQRIVLVNGRLDDVLTDHVSQQLLLLGSTDPDRPIELHLSCREAELSASIALATAIDLTRADEDVAEDLRSNRLLSAEEAAAYGLVDDLL